MDALLTSAPVREPDPEQAARSLSRYLAHGDALLCALPDRSGRTSAEQQVAGEIHDISRTARHEFMSSHGVWLYEELTNGRTVHRRLDELAFAAAERIPGLVPTPQQLTAECSRRQQHKEGYEIDQGIFFSSILRSPDSGTHLVEAMLRATQKAQALLHQFRETGSVSLRTVSVERRGRSGHITMRNDSCLNAEDNDLIDDMETAVDLVLLDDQISVGVLRGGVMTHPKYAGRRVFCAGINLRHLAQGRISFVDFLLRRELGYVNKIRRGLLLQEEQRTWRGRHLDKPWLAVVDSFAIGGGAQLLLVFDRVIAAADAYVSLPAAQEGIVPGVANLRLPLLTAGRLARQMILSGRRILAQEPDARLLIDHVVEAADLDTAVEESAAQLDSAAIRANRRMSTLGEEPLDSFRVYMAEFALTQVQRLYSDDVIAKVARGAG